MTEVENKTRICDLCGKTIHYKVIDDDGRDWCGHQRGKPSYNIVDNGCTCTPNDYKKMCLNCNHYVDGQCINKETITKFNTTFNDDDLFDIQITSIKIKNPVKHCEFWTLRHCIGQRLFKD